MDYIILAILTTTSIIIAFKFFEQFKINNAQAITINYLIASVFGFASYSGDITYDAIPQQDWFTTAIIVGVLFIICFNIFAVSAQKVGVAITAVSSKMSVVIPVVVGLILYEDEKLNMVKILGVICTLFAFYFIFKKEKYKKFNKILVILPILIFLGSGINDSLLNYCENRFIDDSNEVILLISVIFTISLVIGIVVLIARMIFEKKYLTGKNIVAGIVLGLLNFASTYYFIKGLTIYAGSFFIPMFNVSVVGLAALVGYFAFKEKLRLVNWLGILLALLAIFLIAFSENLNSYEF